MCRFLSSFPFSLKDESMKKTYKKFIKSIPMPQQTIVVVSPNNDTFVLNKLEYLFLISKIMEYKSDGWRWKDMSDGYKLYNISSDGVEEKEYKWT